MSDGDDHGLSERGADDAVESARREWLVENRAAIERYNERCEEDGVFSDGLTTF
ncbi:type II toxin-antitoxin system CcdA family antitoxin [Pseudomonas aeruginosa]